MFGLNKVVVLAALNLLVVSDATRLEKRQDLAGLPSCGQSCLLNAFTNSAGGCSQTDFACLCKSTPFLMSTSTCYSTACSSTDMGTSTSWGFKTCASVGVDLSKIAANASALTASHNHTTTTGSSNTTSSLNGTSASTQAKSAGNVLVSSTGLLALSGAAMIAMVAL